MSLFLFLLLMSLLLLSLFLLFIGSGLTEPTLEDFDPETFDFDKLLEDEDPAEDEA